MKRLLGIAICVALLSACTATRAGSKRAAPLIAISAAGEHESRVGQAYIDAVIAAGGVPYIIPIQTDSASVAALITRADGVLMIGGEDIDPTFYGEAALPQMGKVNARRDTFDLLLACICLRTRKPMLAICRGIQAVNVAFGGTLWQDIPSQLPQSGICHKAPEGQAASHSIDIAPGSRLSKVYGCNSMEVNSFHHQSVKDVAPGFTVTARSADGIVEAMERFAGGDRVLAVQFHPEKAFAAGDPAGLRPFIWLVQESQK